MVAVESSIAVQPEKSPSVDTRLDSVEQQKLFQRNLKEGPSVDTCLDPGGEEVKIRFGSFEDQSEVALPNVGGDANHDHHLFALPKDPNCSICQSSRMKEAPARKPEKGQNDPRLVAAEFGDVVHLDTLFLTIGKGGMLEIADE